MDRVAIINAQLQRMRGMTRYYHERFFSDVRSTTIIVISLFGAGWITDRAELFLLVPVICLIGANQTAFDASYLIFARTYASSLEREINADLGGTALLGARLEDEYLFPLGTAKIVTIPLKGPQSWFGWMTALYTLLGGAASVVALAIGWATLSGHGRIWVAAYLLVVGGLTLASAAFGVWWFALGTGERRLREILGLDSSAIGLGSEELS